MTLAALAPDDVGLPAMLALIAVAFVASLARGFSGFGAALIFMPLASTVVSPRIAAPLVLMIDFIAAAPLIPNAWRQADRKAVAIMALGALIGIPLGTLALLYLDPLVTRWIISVFVFALLIMLASGWRYRGEGTPLISAMTGFTSGLCSGLAQSGGPPVVAYWLGRPIAGMVARANIILFFACTNVISASSYFAGGLLNSVSLRLAVLIGPVYALGLFLGTHMFGLASEVLFRSICYGLIALAAVLGLPLLDGVLR